MAFLFLRIWQYLHVVKISLKTGIVIFGIYCAFLAVCYYFFNNSENLYFPISTKFKVDFYTDLNDKGNSEIISTSSTENELGISYILKPNFISPYCGFKIHCNEILNLENFDEIRLEIEATPKSFVKMYILSEDEQVKDKTHPLALRHAQIDLKVESNESSFQIQLRDFETPFWWFDAIKQSKLDFKDQNYNAVHAFAFTSASQNAKNELLYFKVKKIAFLKKHTFQFLGLFLVGLIAFVLFAVKVKITNKSEDVVNPPLLASNHPEFSSPFIDFIQQHYTDSNLTLEKIAQDTGINYRVISESISEQFGCNVKTYINQIRVAEAKRLMLDTKLSISEIAYQTGFNSPANFTRVFKNLTEETPSEFQQKQKNRP